MSDDLHYHRDRDTLCPGPDPHPRPPARFRMPSGAVDTHAHVIGPPPYVETRGYTAPAATESQYLSMLDAAGISHGVLVQVSVHGTDNRLMLDTLRRHPARLRGVAVAPHDLPDAGWAELRQAGVRGLRLNAVSAAGMGLAHLDRYEAICRELGWHLQFITNGEQLRDVAPRLKKLRVPAVIDHMGHFKVAAGTRSPSMATMLDLVAAGAWVKLSGAFRLADEPPYADLTPFARALIEAAPDRCVWGSDWPHVSFWKPMPNVADLLDLLADWAPDERQRHRILVDNPHALYGFTSS